MNNDVEKTPGTTEEIPEVQPAVKQPAEEQPSVISPQPQIPEEKPVPEEKIEGPSEPEPTPEEEAEPSPATVIETPEPVASPEATIEAIAENEAVNEEQTEDNTSETVEVEPEPREISLSVPGFACCLLGGCVLGVVIATLVRKAFPRKRIAPLKASKLRALAVQGIGARSDQQDSFYCSDAALYSQQGLLMCVADGMGGLSNGSIYSRSAVSGVASKFSQLDKTTPEKLVSTLTLSAVASVNRVISPNFGSGGTTLLIGYIQNGRFYYSSVGDSRICLYRDGALFQLNRPHDYEADLMLRHVNNELSFEQVKTYEKRGALTSYLGMGALRYADMAGKPISLRRGDRVVLMSDGVFNSLSEAELCSILSLSASRIEQELAQAVESKKLKYQDNYTAVIVAAE